MKIFFTPCTKNPWYLPCLSELRAPGGVLQVVAWDALSKTCRRGTGLGFPQPGRGASKGTLQVSAGTDGGTNFLLQYFVSIVWKFFICWKMKFFVGFSDLGKSLQFAKSTQSCVCLLFGTVIHALILWVISYFHHSYTEKYLLVNLKRSHCNKSLKLCKKAFTLAG